VTKRLQPRRETSSSCQSGDRREAQAGEGREAKERAHPRFDQQMGEIPTLTPSGPGFRSFTSRSSPSTIYAVPSHNNIDSSFSLGGRYHLTCIYTAYPCASLASISHTLNSNEQPFLARARPLTPPFNWESLRATPRFAGPILLRPHMLRSRHGPVRLGS
jgi:hypothetical protein